MAIVIGFALSGVVATGGEDTPSETSMHPMILSRQVRSSDPSVRNSAYQLLEQQHRQMVLDLVSFVEKESMAANTPGKRQAEPLSDAYWRSTELLTMWRTPDVVPILVRDIERRPPTVVLGGGGNLQVYPNAQALRDLSEVRTPRAILNHLDRYHAEDVSDRAIELYAILLASPVVGETGEWIGYLEPVVKKAREGSKNKANFDRLLLQLDKLNRGERPRF